MEGRYDLIDHGLNVIQNSGICETDDEISRTSQHRIAFLVKSSSCLVNRAIHFDNELGLKADKVHNESVDGVLPAKSRTQFAAAQPLPERIFSRVRCACAAIPA